MNERASTCYLPVERKNKKDITREIQAIETSPLLALLFGFPIFVAITNEYRQIVWANREALSLFRANSLSEVAGKRPGEALGCVHSTETSGGCGTTEYCVFCGAGKSLEASLEGKEGGEESVIRRDKFHGFDSLDLMIWTKAFELSGMRYVVFTAQDLSSQKRREVLERVFYHDILNTAATIKSLASLIELSKDTSDNREYLELTNEAADRLVEEIASQRSLKEAEDGDLAVNIESVSADKVLDKALEPFHAAFRERAVILDRIPPAGGSPVRTDPVLARRVVTNMVRNALEASRKGEHIEAGVEDGEGYVEIWVRNPSILSEEEKKMIFQRSFSTKGVGRGLGTYGMKLLTERYLGGEVKFESRESEGTTFRMRLPRKPAG